MSRASLCTFADYMGKNASTTLKEFVRTAGLAKQKII